MTDKRLDEIAEERGRLTPAGRELLREVNRLRKHVAALESALAVLRTQNDALRSKQ